MVSAEEQAIAAINAAEAMAIQNVQLIQSMKSLFPKQLQPLIGIAPELAEQQIGLVASAERKIVKKVARSRKQRANDKKKAVAWKKANSEGRKNNGQFRAGWTQKKLAQRANKILKKL